MKAKIIKTGDHYYSLMLINNKELLATTEDVENVLKLSLKNCEAIANGYDIDELAESEYGQRFDEDGDEVWDSGKLHWAQHGFKSGFQKALEILGDKKFRALQQTEWDVEVEMELDVIRLCNL